MQHGFIERLQTVVDYVGGQKELERVSGVDQTTISAWLKRAKNPKFQTVKKIGDSTGFAAEWLYLGRGPKRVNEQTTAEASRELDIDLLTEVIEHIESALLMRREQSRIKPREKARLVAAAYDFYHKPDAGQVRRAKILDFLGRGRAPA